MYVGTGTEWLRRKKSPLAWLVTLLVLPLLVVFFLSLLLAVAIVALPFAAIAGIRKLLRPKLPDGPQILPPDEDGGVYSVIGGPTSPRAGSDSKEWPFDES